MANQAQAFVALLRGINNAGNSPRVAMAELQKLFAALGFAEVSTLLNSGNVLFSAAKGNAADHRARIEAALARKLGVAIPVAVLSARELAATVAEQPFARRSPDPSQLLVVVPLERKGLAKLRPLADRDFAPEAFALGRHAAYAWCARGVAKSALWAAVDRALERGGTARNLATMTRLLQRSRELRPDGDDAPTS